MVCTYSMYLAACELLKHRKALQWGGDSGFFSSSKVFEKLMRLKSRVAGMKDDWLPHSGYLQRSDVFFSPKWHHPHVTSLTEVVVSREEETPTLATQYICSINHCCATDINLKYLLMIMPGNTTNGHHRFSGDHNAQCPNGRSTR